MTESWDKNDPEHNLIIDSGRSVVEKEIAGLGEIIEASGPSFVKAVRFLIECRGRVIVMGVGKSGHVGKKIAASMASMGTPAFFVHSDEALHGDLGMLTRDDVVLLLSNSGETLEIVNGLPSIKAIGSKIISITSKPDSTMAKASDVHLCIGRLAEADHLGLAPSTSSTATLVLGDALALTVSRLKNFKKDQFALFHPGGKLGESLTGKAI
jgi:arabinose-5-phosphate isomerase